MFAIELMNAKKETKFGDRVETKKLVAAEELTLKTYKLQGVEHVNNIKETDVPVMLKSICYHVVKRGEGRPIKLNTGTFKTRDGRFRQLYLAGIIREGKLYVVVEAASETVKDIHPLAPLRVVSIGAANRLMKNKFFNRCA